MPAPGYVFRDGGPIPDSDLHGSPEQIHSPTSQENAFQATRQSPQSSNFAIHTPTSSNSKIDVSQSTRQGSTSNSSTVNTPNSNKSSLSASTESHALAEADHELKGAAQQEHFEAEVKNLGWNDDPKNVPTPLVGGLPNEELWLLVRRFNKQMYHVKATPVAPLGGLDLYIAEKDEFSPDKLRANIERLYMTVIVGVVGMGKHIARLRSWREPPRTAAFCTAYFIAWIFNFVVPLIFVTLIVLIMYPPSRAVMFPPAPLALVSSKTGGVQSPAAGVLGSHDSITGAPEKHQGEAVEQEASNFVSGFASIALSSATGKHEQGDPESDPLDKSVPDPTRMALAGADAQTSVAGGSPTKEHDKTKEPMQDAMWTKMRPIMHIIGDVSDGWERFANALSPTAPFPKETPRIKLAGLLVPAVAVSLLTTSAMFMKMTTFSIGLGFFGDPIITRATAWLNREFPHWEKLLEIRNTILKGVPTNAQLTITLLRIGEVNKAPLPPPPTSDKPPSDQPKSLNGDDLALDASNEEIHDAIHADVSETTDEALTEKPKHRHGSRVLGFLKGTTKTGVETKLSADRISAAIGSSKAKNHLGILPKPSEQIVSGPVDFSARYKGKKGWIYLSTSATIPCISFSTHSSNGTGEESQEKLKPIWTVPIEEITEIKKVGGLGWKAKLVVGWATNRNVADGLEIVDKRGERWRTTAIPLREELFNRLVAMGGQKWESW